jgi:hypothetical protein
MSGLVDRIQRSLANPLSRDDVIDPMQELGALKLQTASRNPFSRIQPDR